MKLDKAGYAVKIGFACQPDFFERLLGALLDPKTVHSDEHDLSPDDRNDDDQRTADHAVAKMGRLRKSSIVAVGRMHAASAGLRLSARLASSSAKLFSISRPFDAASGALPMSKLISPIEGMAGNAGPNAHDSAGAAGDGRFPPRSG